MQWAVQKRRRGEERMEGDSQWNRWAMISV
jgi:hypothetical protein